MTIPLHLLDTDIASFIIKARSPEVEARLAAVPPDRICVSAVTRAELMYGLKRFRRGIGCISRSGSSLGWFGCWHGMLMPLIGMRKSGIN